MSVFARTYIHYSIHSKRCRIVLERRSVKACIENKIEMAASTEVKRAKKRKGKVINFDEVGEWKKVEVDPNIFIDGDFSGFSGLEELTNFDVSKVQRCKFSHV